MEVVRDQALKVIQSLPKQATMDDILAELFFKMQLDAGLKELDEGKGIPHEKVKKQISRWITK